MIIDNEIKLDFKDVLIRPRRSSIKSRSDVELNTVHTFKHVKDYIWNGVPIMSLIWILRVHLIWLNLLIIIICLYVSINITALLIG